MKWRYVIFHFVYYVLSVLVYIGFLCLASLLLDQSGMAGDLGVAIVWTYGVFFFLTPVLIAVLMRFSLLRWYFDPIAAAEIPLFLYAYMLISQMKYTETFRSAFLLVNNKLGDDGGMGWLFLLGLFVFGLAASFSFARKRRQSISYRLLAKLGKRGGADGK